MDAHTVGVGLGGLALLAAGGEMLVRGASRIARSAGLSALVVGLTVVAFGTSAPELAVSVQASLAGRADLAVGNVVGSNIFNVLLILGASAVVAPLAVRTRLVRHEVPLMIASALLLLGLAADGTVARWEGGLLLGGLVAYTWYALREGRRAAPEGPAGPVHGGGRGTGPGTAADAGPGERADAEGGGVLIAVGGLVAGVTLLVLGARWLVDAAARTARSMGVDELTIGATVVAAGTSLPELATSVTAAARGQRDIAVGNVVGSNLMNVLGILGAASALAPGGIAVAPAVLHLDLPVVIAVSVACLPIFFTGFTISRWEGLLLLGHYGAYVTYLILAQRAHAALPAFSRTMWLFVLPVTTAVLALTAYRAWRP